jgi:hypothetical protein
VQSVECSNVAIDTFPIGTCSSHDRAGRGFGMGGAQVEVGHGRVPGGASMGRASCAGFGRRWGSAVEGGGTSTVVCTM